VDALTRAEGEALAAMIRGLELLGSDHTLRAAARTLAAAGPRGAGALCRLKAFRRAAVGDELLTAFESDDTPARCDAVRAALHGQVERAERVIVSALRDDEPLVRAAAIEAGVAGGIREAWDEATRLARSQEVSSGGCLKLVAMLGTADDHEAVYASLRKPPLQRDAIWALGHIGTIRAAEACLAGMQHEPLARASGEAYCWITGADLVRDRLAADEAPHDAPPFEEDDLDADLVPSPETLWPLPDPDAVRRDWLARRPRFIQDARHIQGRPATTDTLLGLIETGPMLRRPDLILELRARTRGRYDVEPRAFAARQRRMMVAGRTAASGLGR
jgi:uncharacterized protein (TIGR02270 family)